VTLGAGGGRRRRSEGVVDEGGEGLDAWRFKRSLRRRGIAVMRGVDDCTAVRPPVLDRRRDSDAMLSRICCL